MANNLDNLGLTPAADLSVQTVTQIQAASYKLPSPTLVANAVVPEVFLIKRRKRRNCITYEAAGCMRVHSEQEWNEQVMRIPKSLKRLLSDPVVSSRVHQ